MVGNSAHFWRSIRHFSIDFEWGTGLKTVRARSEDVDQLATAREKGTFSTEEKTKIKNGADHFSQPTHQTTQKKSKTVSRPVADR